MDYLFNVSVSAERLLAMYRGQAQHLVVHSHQGLKLQLPLSNFREFVDQDGLHGLYRVTVDENNKLQSLQKLQD